MKRTTPNKQGFTLIELSIVLVIIGLIVGGVLVGQDLIKAAEVRATVGQIEKYNSAVNTFRSKFTGIPGDLLSTTAAAFSFTTRTGAAGHGNGNNKIEGCSADAMVFGCETGLFWRDLSAANLIDGSFVSATDALTEVVAADHTLYFPGAKVNLTNFVTVFTNGGLNYYPVGGISLTDSSGVYTLALALTPTEAYNMDNKIDDGMPLTGVVVAKEGTTALNITAVAGAAVCVINSSGSPYNTTTTYGATRLCHLRFRMN